MTSLTPPSSRMLADLDLLAMAAINEAEKAKVSRIMAQITRHLTRPPRIALIGEFRTGKSSLAHALLGEKAFPKRLSEKTQFPILIHYAPKVTFEVERSNGDREPLLNLDHLDPARVRFLRFGLPNERLKTFEIIDTPGFATGKRDADARALDACQRSHIAIWCTAAMQAWKRTELRVWQSLPKRLQQNGVLAVTFLDAINSERDVSRLRARLRREVAPQFRDFVMVSATGAMQSNPELNKGASCQALWQSSGGSRFAQVIASAINNETMNRWQNARVRLEEMVKQYMGRAQTA